MNTEEPLHQSANPKDDIRMSVGRYAFHLLPLGLAGLVILAFCIRKVASLDIWWHLAAGRWIVENRGVPRVDVFSYTIEGKPWIDVWWGFQLLQFLAFKAVGLNGLILIKSALITAAFAVSVLTAPKRYRSTFLVVLCLLGAIIGQLRFHIRPTAASYLFLAVYLYAIEQDLSGKRYWLWALLPLHLIWTNMHGVAVVGIVVLMISAASEFARACSWYPSTWKKDDNAPTRYRQHLATGLGCFAVSFMTPYGIDGVRYCWGQYFWLTGDDAAAVLLHEHWSPFSAEMARHPITSFCYWAFSIITAGTFLLKWSRLRLRDILLYAAFFHLFQSGMRNAVFFALVAIPIAARNWGWWWANLNSRSAPPERSFVTRLAGRRTAVCSRVFVCILASLLIFDVCTGRYYRRERGDFEFGLGAQSGLYPESTTRFLGQMEPAGKLFNDFDFGGYLIWHQAPKWKVFIDNRNFVFGDIARDYARSRGSVDAFDKLLATHQFQYVLLKHVDSANDALIRALAKRKEWSCISYDEVSVLFSSIPSSELLTHDWRQEQPVSGRFWYFSRKLTRLARLFENMDRSDFAEEAYTRAQPDRLRDVESGLVRDDLYVPALVGVAEFYMANGQELRALPYLEKAVFYEPQTLERLYSPQKHWAELHARLGYLYAQAGAKEKARKALAEAVRLRPEDMESKKLLDALRAPR